VAKLLQRAKSSEEDTPGPITRFVSVHGFEPGKRDKAGKPAGFVSKVAALHAQVLQPRDSLGSAIVIQDSPVGGEAQLGQEVHSWQVCQCEI
jgi:hypothetical protein